MTTRKYPAEFPIEVGAFKSMHNRLHRGIVTSVEWPRTTNGFYAFLKFIGPVPKQMRRPSIGRKDHSKGYNRSNCEWQELTYNLSLPRRPFERTDEHRRKMSIAQKGKKKSAEHCLNMSKAAIKRLSDPKERKRTSSELKRAWALGLYDNRKPRRKSKP